MKKLATFLAVSHSIATVNLMGLDYLPEIRAAYYYETDHLTRDIYGSAALFNVEFNIQTSAHSMPFVALGYLHQDGYSLSGHDSTSLYTIPIEIGYKYLFLTNNIQPYLGLALDISYVHIKNNSPFVIPTQAGWAVGFKPKSGVLFFPDDHFFIDVFLDYTYLEMCFSDEDDQLVYNKKLDLSGLSVGAGIGYKF